MTGSNLFIPGMVEEGSFAHGEALRFGQRGIHRLSDLKKQPVGEIWRWAKGRRGEPGLFVPLVQAMQKHGYIFKDCDDDVMARLLDDDIEALDIPTSAKNVLVWYHATSFELLRRLRYGTIAGLSGMGGRQGKTMPIVVAVLATAGVQFLNED